MGTSKYSSCPSGREFGRSSRTISPVRRSTFCCPGRCRISDIRDSARNGGFELPQAKYDRQLSLSAGRQFADEIALRERAAVPH
jgi:hypothetical protein